MPIALDPETRRILELTEELRALVEEPKWVRPKTRPGDEDSEHNELTRTAKELGVPSRNLNRSLATARLGRLSDKHWKSMDNTTSYGTDKASAEWDAKKHNRDIDRIYKGFEGGDEMPAPIVLHRPGKPPYLVGGNTRLMAAAASGIRPKVLHVRLKGKPKK